MPELEAQVGAPEAVYGDGQFEHLAPARTVVVVQNKGAVLCDVGLPWAQTDAILGGEMESKLFLLNNLFEGFQTGFWAHDLLIASNKGLLSVLCAAFDTIDHRSITIR